MKRKIYSLLLALACSVGLTWADDLYTWDFTQITTGDYPSELTTKAATTYWGKISSNRSAYLGASAAAINNATLKKDEDTDFAPTSGLTFDIAQGTSKVYFQTSGTEGILGGGNGVYVNVPIADGQQVEITAKTSNTSYTMAITGAEGVTTQTLTTSYETYTFTPTSAAITSGSMKFQIPNKCSLQKIVIAEASANTCTAPTINVGDWSDSENGYAVTLTNNQAGSALFYKVGSADFAAYTGQFYAPAKSLVTAKATLTDYNDGVASETMPAAPAHDINLTGNQYAIASTETVGDGMRVIGTDITMTYGNDGSWGEPVEGDAIDATYTHRVNGNGNIAVGNVVPTSGTYYVFTPTADGQLDMMVKINSGKDIYVLEDGEQIAATAGTTTVGHGESVSSTYKGALTFNVTANKTYHVFCTSSKMMLYGFNFTLGSHDDPDPTPTTSCLIWDYSTSTPSGNPYNGLSYGSIKSGTTWIKVSGDASATLTLDTNEEGILTVTYASTSTSAASFDVTPDGGEKVSFPTKDTNDHTSDLIVPASAENHVFVFGRTTKEMGLKKIVWRPLIDTYTLNPNGYATFSYAEAVQIVDADVYTATVNTGEATITMNKVEAATIPAGNGAFIYSEENSSFKVFAAESAQALPSNDLRATTDNTDALVAVPATGYNYVLSGDQFLHYTGATFAANKAFFNLAEQPAAGAPMMIIFADEEVEEGITTAVENIAVELDLNAPIYNVLGQRVPAGTKGVLIQNGKKYFVK